MNGRARIDDAHGPLSQTRDVFVTAIRSGDARAAAAVYAEDARVHLPGGERMDGRSAIEAFWRVGLQSGMAGLSLAPGDVLVERSFACETGRYILHVAPDEEVPTEERGRYMTVLRRSPAGAWLRALEIYEPDAEAQPG